MPTIDPLALTDAELQAAIDSLFSAHHDPPLVPIGRLTRAVAAAQLAKCRANMPFREAVRAKLIPILIEELAQVKASHDQPESAEQTMEGVNNFARGRHASFIKLDDLDCGPPSRGSRA